MVKTNTMYNEKFSAEIKQNRIKLRRIHNPLLSNKGNFGSSSSKAAENTNIN